MLALTVFPVESVTRVVSIPTLVDSPVRSVTLLGGLHCSVLISRELLELRGLRDLDGDHPKLG
jgi:hypothetical protein